MPSVDNRVVRIEFDNRDFNNKVKSTLDSLDKLNKALKFEGAQKGLTGVQDASKKLNFGHIGTNIDGVNKKFLTMTTGMQKGLVGVEDASKKVTFSTVHSSIESVGKKFTTMTTGAQHGIGGIQAAGAKVNLDGTIGTSIEHVNTRFLAMTAVAIAALSNLTTAAGVAGIKLTKSLAIDPILDGYREYETNIGSIQTILANTASKGTNLEQVNAALDELNVYSDKTIYNFGQMAKNIGTFTAAGVGLNEATGAIKGIANLAAMSGSTADQASSAMYQLSQAMASGQVKAQDWISVVNAGMGGEAFQKSLFETARALKTVKNVPIGQTFEEWKKKGGNFKELMSKGVITAKVLSTTLEAFTGDLTKQQLKAKGYSDAQADMLLKQAKIASDAATQVKTFTQLLGTVKEAVGTGWADTFKIVVGNFEEAKKLWTNVNNVIGSIVSNQAKARNDLLKGWKAFGGRTTLLKGFATAWKNIISLINPVRLALRTIFPRTTVATLLKMTLAFENFAKSLKPSGPVVVNLFRVFRGLFAVLSIGWTVIKEGIKFISHLAKTLFGLAGPGFLEFAAKIGDVFFALQQFLIKGKGIANFFKALGEIVTSAVPFIEFLKDAIADLFSTLFDWLSEKLPTGWIDSIKSFFTDFDIGSVGDQFSAVADAIKDFFGGFGDPKIGDKINAVGDATGRVGDRVKSVGGIFEKMRDIWKPIGDALSKVWDILVKIGGLVKDFFVDLGKNIADVMGKGSFNNVIDLINVGLLGAIALTLRKFFKKGIKFDVGDGMFAKMGKMFQEVGNTFKQLQQAIKVDTLMKIAKALLLMTISIVALSLVDSAALTKALVAMAVGFGQLIGVLTAIEKLDFSFKSVAKFLVLAAVFAILSVSMIFFSRAAQRMASLDWQGLSQGLLGILAILGMLVGVVKLLKDDLPVYIGTALALIGFAVAVNVLYIAVKKFSEMDPVKLVQGMTAAGAAITGLVLALKYMPEDIDKKGFAVLKLAFALFILGFSVQKFADMDNVKLAKGLGSVTLGLIGLAKAFDMMPADMKSKSEGLLFASIGLIIIAKALEMIAKMSIAEIVTSVLTLAVVLSIITEAMDQATLAIPGAQALLIIAASLLLLATVLKTFAAIPFGDLLKGLLGIVLVITVLAAAAAILSESGLIVAMEALGIALLTIGAGFALFGAGAYLAVQALQAFADMGEKGARRALEAIGILGSAIPYLMSQLVQGFIDGLVLIGEQAPKIAEMIGKVIAAIVDQVIILIPKFAEAIRQFIIAGLGVVRTLYAEYVKTGLFIILTLLQGIRDNIGEIVRVVGEIVVNFLNALGEEVPRIIDAMAELWLNIMTGLAEKIGEMMVRVGPELAMAFWNGLLKGLEIEAKRVYEWFTAFPGKILDIVKNLFGIDSPATTFMDIGVDLIQGLMDGINSIIQTVWDFFTQLPGKILGFIGDVTRTLWNIGVNLIQGFIDGYMSIIQTVWDFFSGLSGKILEKVGDALTWLKDTGSKVFEGLKNGLEAGWHWVTEFLAGIPFRITSYLFEQLGGPLEWLKQFGNMILQGLADGVKAGGAFLKTAWNAAISWLPDFIEDKLKIKSPSLVMMYYGKQIVAGLVLGIENQGKNIKKAMTDILDRIMDTSQKATDALKNFNANNATFRANAQKNVAMALKEWNAADANFRKHAHTFLAEDHTIATFGRPEDAHRREAALKALDAAYKTLGDMEKLNPVITPVLDLTKIREDASKLSDYISAGTFSSSLNQARIISSNTNTPNTITSTSSAAMPGQVNFNQTINAPEQLSTADIYKQTRNQITMAKKELSIP